MKKNKTYSLCEFIWIWYYVQNLPFPKHHKMMAEWLQETVIGKKQNSLLMAFRSSGKSTVTGLFCSWLLFCNPNLRLLILAADFELAKKMVRNIKRIIERHPLTSFLLPKNKDQWASDRFTVNRDSELRDPSVLARGLGANITGSRADMIICDDVEVPKTCDTSGKRAELRAKLSELDFILAPGGNILYIGTPHTFYTIYETKQKSEDNLPFLENYQTLRIPVLNKFGESAWPERFPIAKIKKLKERAGPNKFSAQMMLIPINYTGGRLNVDDLIFYDEELSYSEANNIPLLTIGEKRMLSVSCWWDPSFGKKDKGDFSVIACVFTSDDGLYRLHDIDFISCPENSKTDNASYQVAEVIEFCKRNHIPAVHIETNGIGKFLPGILRKELNKQGLRIAVYEENSTANKEQRILDAFDAPLSAKALYVHKKIALTPFLTQMREWTPTSYKGKDDALDAVAGCLLSEPIRMPSFTAQNKKVWEGWQGKGESFIAETSFSFN